MTAQALALLKSRDAFMTFCFKLVHGGTWPCAYLGPCTILVKKTIQLREYNYVSRRRMQQCETYTFYRTFNAAHLQEDHLQHSLFEAPGRF